MAASYLTKPPLSPPTQTHFSNWTPVMWWWSNDENDDDDDVGGDVDDNDDNYDHDDASFVFSSAPVTAKSTLSLLLIAMVESKKQAPGSTCFKDKHQIQIKVRK